MSLRDFAIEKAINTFAGNYVTKIAESADNEQDAAKSLRMTLNNGGYSDPDGRRVNFNSSGIDYQMRDGSEEGRVTYLELARHIRNGPQPTQESLL